MRHVEKTIEVEAPVGKVYSQWTHFEEFPEFMEGVEEVRQIDEKRIHWVADIAGKKKEWDTEILEQVPDQKVSWRSINGALNSGTVEFVPKGVNHTQVTLKLDYEPEAMRENLDHLLGVVSKRVEGDLERFKNLMRSVQGDMKGLGGETDDCPEN